MNLVENLDNNSVDNTVVDKTPVPLTPEQKAQREATRAANEAALETVRAEAEAEVMTQYGFPGMAMTETLRAQASTQAAIRKAAKAMLKGESAPSVRGVPKIEKDTKRCSDQLIRSLEFADRNGLLKREGDADSIFISILKDIFLADVAADTFDTFVSSVKEPKDAAADEAAEDAEPAE